ncbi:heat shock 70 kDa protein 1A [Mus pahari]|uniref:heat shock 70 kDa protein 1A n=1 Tax=Mus pahari TaxID=10093 RepID=UPI000A30652C|nr:heat shock 70 kDa protein 1A [Mus pahari]
MAKNTAIGIDLGTTYSCVGVFQHGKVEIIANDQGNRTTPSYVAFTDTERLIGDAAKNQVALNPQNTVFDAKRLIGRKFGDAVVQSDMKHWPFQVVNDGDKPKVQVNYKGESRSFFPEEISSMVLTKMKEISEAYLGHPVTNAVITVPAYFNDSQRQATKDAGVIAGLNVLRIINEPTAAAIAYGLDRTAATDKSTGKANKITITNDKGRLSKEEIERMVQEAERYKAEDEVQRDRVAAKNALESYAFNMKSAVEDEGLKGKLSEADKKKVLDKCQEVISWLDSNTLADKEEFVHKREELERVCSPIISGLYQGAGASGAGGFGAQAPKGGSGSGPTIEEVD